MNVHDLRERLAAFPDDTPVMVTLPYDNGWCITTGEIISVRSRAYDCSDPNAGPTVLLEADKSESKE